MASYTRDNKAAHNPSAPPIPDATGEPQLAYPYNTHQPTSAPTPPNYSHPSPYNPPQATAAATQHGYGYGYGYGYGSGQPPYGYHQQQQPYSTSMFPPGTDPEVIRSFEMVDRDRSGSIEEKELREALSSSYQKFSLRTIRLLIFLFNTNPSRSSSIGPKEFAALWSCLVQWRAIFERFDRDRSGKIDSAELRDAFYSIGYAIPPSVLEVLISRYDDGSGRKVELGFDAFVECGMIVKGLTEKFKEKDRQYTGSAALAYEEFMSMIIPFLAAD